MSDDEETYCRLCAEPTPITQLISSHEDVAITSKITTKMSWINVDISTSNTLPTTICFSCFDLLERTWSFLHNVRTAQVKLQEIFMKKDGEENLASTKNEKCESSPDALQPVDKDWEVFQTKTEVKCEIQIEDADDVQIVTIDPNSLVNFTYNGIKTEQQSDFEIHSDGVNSTDSDLPLQLSAKKKKLKKKKSDTDYTKLDKNNDVSIPSLSWDEYMCRCATCDAQCKNITSLQLHSLQIHACCCIFKCSDCGKISANYKSFVNHVRIHKKLLRFCCEFCNKRYKTATKLKKHYNISHRSIYLTMCHNCGACFDTQELLQDHIILYTKGYKKRGVKRETIENDLKCEHCSKEFKSRSNLQQHKLVHLPRSRDFSCHVCGKMFFTKGTLSTHMMTHEDSKPYKCEYCPMAFRARGNLQSHVSLHSGAKPFVCEQCGKSFRVKRHLKSHSIVHTDLMPYVCEYCNKTFRFKTRLNLHLRQHTGAKPYNCIYCQRDFTNGSNFKKHMKRRHNIDTSKKRYNNVVNETSLQNSDDVNSSQT